MDNRLPHQRVRPFHVLKQLSDCCQEFHVTFLGVPHNGFSREILRIAHFTNVEEKYNATKA